MSNISRAQWALAVLAAFAVLLAPALWNGYPLLQYDTGGYLARPFEGYLVPSRSAPYGLFLAATWKFDFWPAIVVQAAATIWILALALRVNGFGGRPFLLLGLIALLSLTTSLALIASTLLTDIFAGLGLLALYLVIVKGGMLSWRERAALVAFTGFCGSTHTATIAVLFALAAALLLVLWFARALPAGSLRRGALALVLGVLMTFAANFAVSGRAAWTPGGYGIVFGRLLQDGLVTRYLDEHCPDPALKLCPYRDRLPDSADAFLWGDGVFNTLGRFAGMNEEMRAIVLGSLRDHPWLNVKAAAIASARQLVYVASGEGVLNIIWHTYGIIERYTPSAVPGMRAARQQRGEWSFETINMVHIPAALISVALLPVFVGLALRNRRFGDLDWLAVTILLALLANAAICGVLSNPHNRYGARLAWAATIAAALLLPRQLSRRSGSALIREAHP